MNKRFVVIIFLFTVCITASCGGAQQNQVISQPTRLYAETNKELVFSGKVENPNNGEWINNRLVLLFLNSKEIARTTTSTMEYSPVIVSPFVSTEEMIAPIGSVGREASPSDAERLDGNLKIADGLFVLRTPNTYKLNLSNLGISIDKSPFVQIVEGDKIDRLAVWINPFNEGDSREFYIPSKNIRFTLKVLPGDISQLPAAIQKPGSVILDGKRLVAVDPNTPKPTLQPASPDIVTKFEQVVKNVIDFPAIIFPINNCSGTAEVKREVTKIYIHEINNGSGGQFGVEIPILDWLKIVAEIEQHYSISDKQITIYSTMLTVPAGKNIQYTLIHKQEWESGIAVVVSHGVEISSPYKILKSEIFEVANSEQKSCP